MQTIRAASTRNKCFIQRWSRFNFVSGAHPPIVRQRARVSPHACVNYCLSCVTIKRGEKVMVRGRKGNNGTRFGLTFERRGILQSRGRVVSNNTLAKSKYVALFVLFRPLSRDTLEDRLLDCIYIIFSLKGIDRRIIVGECFLKSRGIRYFFNSLFTDVSKTRALICTSFCTLSQVVY